MLSWQHVLSTIQRPVQVSARLSTRLAATTLQTSAPVAFQSRDVLPVTIKVITIGKGNSQAAENMAEEWQDKVKRYTKCEHLNVKSNPKKTGNPEIQKQAESDKVLSMLNSGDYVVVLDERGTRVTSHDIARILARAGDASARSIVFCIGGPYGHTEDFRARANEVIRLSDLVLNHQVARVVLMEQLYRGWSIIRNEPYHH